MDEQENRYDESLKELLGVPSKKEFKTPDGYFEGFQGRVHDRIYQEQKAWWLTPKFRVITLGIASLAIGVFMMKDFKNNIDIANNSFSKEELLAYYSDNIDEISEYEILDLMSDEELNSFTQVVVLDSISVKDNREQKTNNAPTLDDFSDEEIYEYMLDEGYEDGDWDEL